MFAKWAFNNVKRASLVRAATAGAARRVAESVVIYKEPRSVSCVMFVSLVLRLSSCSKTTLQKPVFLIRKYDTLPSRAHADARHAHGRHQRPRALSIVSQLTAGCPKDDRTIAIQHGATLPTTAPSERSP